MKVNTLINSFKINAFELGKRVLDIDLFSSAVFDFWPLKKNASDFSLISHCIPGNFSHRILSNRFRAYEGHASNQSANNRPVDPRSIPARSNRWLECCCVDQGKGLAFVSFTLVHDKVLPS
jgi:hypothetical protein